MRFLMFLVAFTYACQVHAQSRFQPISVSEFVSITEPESSRVDVRVFKVPRGKILEVEYVSIYLDIAVRNEPNNGTKIEGTVRGGAFPQQRGLASFELGYMEEYDRTSRGTPNFIIGKAVKLYFSQGDVVCTADSHFAGSDLDFGIMACSISGRLYDRPVR